jgi:hypothetical protein
MLTKIRKIVHKPLFGILLEKLNPITDDKNLGYLNLMISTGRKKSICNFKSGI